MKDLKISVSGVRGIFKNGLTEQVAFDFGLSFGALLRKKKNNPVVLVGRDTRQSGQAIKDAFFKGLTKIGCRIIDIEIAPTPTVILMTRQLGADGGCAITASHNPAKWNGLKFIDKDGFFLNSEKMEALYSIYFKKGFNIGKIQRPGRPNTNIRKDFNSIDRHIKKILDNLDTQIIRKRNFKVAIDCCNGAGSVMTEKFLEALGCRVTAINDTPNGKFPHNPEPNSKNIQKFCEFLRLNRHHIGFAQDPDADRLAIVSDKGLPLSEEDTLALAVRFVLKKNRTSVVINLSTSRRIEDIATELGSRVYRAKVGEANVAAQMKRIHALIGGEGNGGVIFPKINFCRDSFVGMGLVLQYMAEEGLSITDLSQQIPSYFMIKEKFEFPMKKSPALLERFNQKFKIGKKDSSDGFRFEQEDFWFHIRPSNTEPVIRVVVEAKTEKEANKVYSRIKAIVKTQSI